MSEKKKEKANNLKFESAVFFVRDVEISKNFYANILGQKIIMDFGRNVAFEGNLAIWEKEYALNTIFSEKAKKLKVGGNNVEIYFESTELEEIYKKLQIPYRVLDIVSGDLGTQAYKKYDLEAWMPGKQEFGEITSTSNCTDYQSRRLNIRYKDRNGENKIAYMLNGTAIAVPRVIIAILENYQNEDSSVNIPEILIPYLGIKVINKK